MNDPVRFLALFLNACLLGWFVFVLVGRLVYDLGDFSLLVVLMAMAPASALLALGQRSR